MSKAEEIPLNKNFDVRLCAAIDRIFHESGMYGLAINGSNGKFQETEMAFFEAIKKIKVVPEYASLSSPGVRFGQWQLCPKCNGDKMFYETTNIGSVITTRGCSMCGSNGKIERPATLPVQEEWKNIEDKRYLLIDGNAYYSLAFVQWDDGDFEAENIDGSYRVLISKNETGYYVANAMDGWGNNAKDHFKDAKVILLNPLPFSKVIH